MRSEVDQLLRSYVDEEERPNGSWRISRPELKSLLASYLETAEEACRFALPRCDDVDELLRRYVLDREDVAGALESTLRRHVTSQHPSVASGSEEWVSRAAAQLREVGTLEVRLDQYAAAVAEADEKQHEFSSDHISTLKGVAPPVLPDDVQPAPLAGAPTDPGIPAVLMRARR